MNQNGGRFYFEIETCALFQFALAGILFLTVPKIRESHPYNVPIRTHIGPIANIAKLQ